MAAFYINSVGQFINEPYNSIVGSLTEKAGIAGFHSQLHTQTNSWIEEIQILQSSFDELCGAFDGFKNFGILLEYPIARRDKRIDVVLITDSIIIVIEFKYGRADYTVADKEQLMDYCLDIRDFHFESRNKKIIPILLATEANEYKNKFADNGEAVQNIVFSNSASFANSISQVLTIWDKEDKTIDYTQWDKSIYSPTPTIIEAAQTLYAGKSVKEIARSHAGGINLTKTTNAVLDAIELAKKNNEKIICFITGVPGAGKTLAGLNIAHHIEFQNPETSLATFLSGNGPLIKVLREALSRDAFKKIKRNDSTAKKKETDRIISFIENVHRFVDTYFLEKESIPNNKIVIFDEAQRAWNAEHSFRKFQRPFSEPQMMIEIMDRHKDWGVIVALVGGGQEINTGEAGLPEWGKVLQEKFSDWKIYISPELKIGNHSTGNLTLFEKEPTDLKIIENEDLHLTVAIRSYKAEKLSHWVSLVLTNNQQEAETVFNQDLKDYGIVITRDLDKAREWLNRKCKGSRRMGLVASSGGRRLRAYGLDVKMELEEAAWFLNPRTDVRSSYYLEIPATEFGIQGLELDWVGVCWDADLRRVKGELNHKAFKGSKWQNVSIPETQKYLINKYRVLMTRAREGMVIFVPKGNVNDPTALPEFYNSTANYLISCGVKEI
jgi:hypothetical protein